MFKIYAPFKFQGGIIMINFKDICENIIEVEIEIHDDDEELFIALHDIDVRISSIKKVARRLKKSEGDLNLLTIASAIGRYAELKKLEYFSDKGYRIKISKMIEVFEAIAIED